MTDPAHATSSAAPLSPRQRWLVLVAGFLGWMFAGLEISLYPLIGRPALVDMLSRGTSEPIERQVKQWLSWYVAAFLCGAAVGGWLFGMLGDRRGRVKALAASVLCYSLVTGATWFAVSPAQLLVLRFLACLGIGGAWPNAVSLVAEAWPDVSRPTLAGLLGAAANFGFVLLGVVGYYIAIEPDSWRWVLLVGASPALVGVWCWWAVPESPRWLAGRAERKTTAGAGPLAEVFRPPLVRSTLLGICLGAVPVVGTAVSAVWVTPWADHVAPNPALKAWTQITRSSGAALGSLVGGWLANLIGRRIAYFLISLATLGVSLVIYGTLDPLDAQFSLWVFLLGFAGVMYFGWLPLYLPELFPTRVRSTGIGVTFNSGRLLAAIGALAAGVALERVDLDYARLGLWTSAVYAVGMLVICFAPDTSGKKLAD